MFWFVFSKPAGFSVYEIPNSAHCKSSSAVEIILSVSYSPLYIISTYYGYQLNKIDIQNLESVPHSSDELEYAKGKYHLRKSTNMFTQSLNVIINLPLRQNTRPLLRLTLCISIFIQQTKLSRLWYWNCKYLQLKSLLFFFLQIDDQTKFLQMNPAIIQPQNFDFDYNNLPVRCSVTIIESVQH